MITPPDASASSLTERLQSLVLPPLTTDPPATSASEEAVPMDLFESTGAEKPEDTYGAALFRRVAARTAVDLSLSRTSARISSGEDGATQASLQSTQLEFSFVREVRAEELVAFQRRTNDNASRMGQADRARYLETSQRIAARFEVNISISAASLRNFASESEAAAGDDELIGRLLEFTNQLLEKADALFNEFFSGLTGGNIGEGIESLFAEFQDSFLSGDFFESLQGLFGEGAAPAGGGNSTAVAASQLEFSFSASFEVTAEGKVQESDPIVLDLDGDGIELTSYTNGARFDILGTGSIQQTAFVTGGDAFLALDRNGNGRIDSGLELFGDQRGARNGFEELRRLDTNGDGRITGDDVDFDALTLFRDDGDGETEEGELIGLRDAGISAIDLNYAEVNLRAAGGNRIEQIAQYQRNDGTYGRAADAILSYIA